MATPGTDDVGGLETSEMSELHRTAKWREPHEETKEEDDLSHWRRTEAVPERGGLGQLPCHAQARPLVVSDGIDAKNWPRHGPEISVPSKR